MAAPYVASKGTASAVTTGASTPTYPASIVANDIIFLLAISHQPVSIGVIDTPSGFAEVAQGTYQNNSSVNQGRAALFWRRASGSLSGTVSVTRTGDTGTDGVFYSQIYRVVGAVTSGDPWDAATTDYGPGNATVDVPAVTVSGAERTLLAFIAQADNASTVDPPANYVGLVSDTTATGTDAELRLCHRRNIDAGSATTATGGETEGWAVFHLSMIPATTYSAPAIALTGDAIRFDGAQDVMKLDPVDSTGLLYCTITCWAKMSVDRNNYSTIFAIEDGAGHSTAYNELITDSDGTTLSVYDHVTGDIANVQAMTVGTWYAIGFKITAGAWKSYIGTEGFTSLTTATGSLTNILFNDLFGVGSTTFTATETFNGMFSQFRVWSGALSDAEIKAELQSSRPVRINDLVGSWFPLGVGSGTETTATYGNAIVSRGVGTPDWTFAAGPLMTLLTSGAATEGDDTSTASGTVGGGSTVTASGTPTEGADTSSGAGALVPVGSGTPTEGTDTSTASGKVVIVTSGAMAEGADTSTASGKVVAVGLGASTEGSDTCSASGVVGDAPPVSASGAATEGTDTPSATGVVVIVGSSSVTEGLDTSSGTAYLVVAGLSAITESADSSSGAGALVPVAIGSFTELSDSSAGAVAVVIVGLGAHTESGDTASGAGVVGDEPVTSSGAVTEASDSVSASGRVLIIGVSAVTEANDTVYGLVTIPVAGTGTPIEGSDSSTGQMGVGEIVLHYSFPKEVNRVLSVRGPNTCTVVETETRVRVQED